MTTKQIESTIVDLVSRLTLAEEKLAALTAPRPKAQPAKPKTIRWCDTIDEFVQAKNDNIDITPLPTHLCAEAIKLANTWRANDIAAGREYHWIRICDQKHQRTPRPA